MRQIIHRGQHPYRHKAQEVGYFNPAQPTWTSVKTALDDVAALTGGLNWRDPVATKALLPLTGNTINDARIVQDDGDGKPAIYVCIATVGTVDQQWQNIRF